MKTCKGVCRAKKAKERSPALGDVLVYILLFFILPRDNETKMVLVVHQRYSLTIQLPRLNVLEILHINPGPSDNDLSLVSFKFELVLQAEVTDNAEGTLVVEPVRTYISSATQTVVMHRGPM